MHYVDSKGIVTCAQTNKQTKKDSKPLHTKIGLCDQPRSGTLLVSAYKNVCPSSIMFYAQVQFSMVLSIKYHPKAHKLSSADTKVSDTTPHVLSRLSILTRENSMQCMGRAHASVNLQAESFSFQSSQSLTR